VKIFLVENSPLLVRRLGEMLSALPGVVLVGHAPDAKQAIEQILKLRPKVVLLDIELDEGTGLDVLSALRKKAPETDAYMLTNHVSPTFRLLAEQLGANGYFDKTNEFEKLRDLIARRAANGVS